MNLTPEDVNKWVFFKMLHAKTQQIQIVILVKAQSVKT